MQRASIGFVFLLLSAAASAQGPNPANFLKDMDKDGDGAVSKKEMAGQLFIGDFEKMDANKDGKVTMAEFQLFMKSIPAAGPPASFKDMDKNADGAVSKEEMAGQPYIGNFEKMDANKDGKVSKSEFDLFMKSIPAGGPAPG